MKSASASQESQPAIYICGSLFEQNGLRIHGQSTPAISRRQRGDIPLTVIMLDWCTTRASPRQINATSRHTYLQRMYMNVNVCIYIYIFIYLYSQLLYLYNILYTSLFDHSSDIRTFYFHFISTLSINRKRTKYFIRISNKIK